MSRFSVQVFKGFVGNILTAVIGFVGSIVFARVLGPAGYGAFYVISAAVSLADNPMQGFAEAGKKRMSESDSNEAKIVGATLCLGILATILLCPLVLLFGIPLIDINREGELFVVLFTGVMFFKLLQPLVAGSGEFGMTTLLDSGRSFFTITFQLVLVLIGWGLGGMVAGLALGSAVMVPVSLRVLGIRASWPSREVISSLWEYARWSMPKNVVGTAISRMDILLLSVILTTGAAGQYRVAMNVLVPATFVSGVIGSGVFIETSEMISKEKVPTERIELGLGFGSILAIPVFFGAVAMPQDIVTTIYGSQYETAGTILVALAAYKFFETQTDQLLGAISGFDRPDLRFYISVCVLVMNLSLGIILGYQFGIIGVVIATLVTAIFQWLIALVLTRRLVSFQLFPRPIRRQFIAGLVMFGAVVLLHRLYGVAWWGDLLAIVSVGAAVYWLILLGISSQLRVALQSLLDSAV